MSVIINHQEVFPEGSTRGVEITFKDSQGNEVTPNSASWSLTTAPTRRDQSQVINNRSGVTISDLDSTKTIILSGSDLQVLQDEAAYRYVRRALLVDYTYDDPVLGNDATDRIQYIFRVENLYNIS